MTPYTNISHEQMREIELAYPNSANPVLSWQKDTEKRALAERRRAARSGAIAELAEKLMSDLEGVTLTRDFMAIIAERAFDHAEEVGDAAFRRGENTGCYAALDDGAA